jgi:hypothetical protein
MDDSEPKVKTCNQNGCELPATHTLVWAKHKFYCPIHVQKVWGVAEFMGFPIAEFMGFPTPANTVRKLTPLEMIDESEDA